MTDHHEMQTRQDIRPSFMFRIDEIFEREDALENVNNEGKWLPLAVPGQNLRHSSNHGVSGQWWYFNGLTIQHWAGLPPNASHYSTFSMYYSGGAGLYVLMGDATIPADDENWLPIMFEHHDDFSSTVLQAGPEPTLRSHDPNARWPSMLFPSIYYGPPLAPYPGRGGLTGELPIFLALIALSMRASRLPHILPHMVQNGQWATHNEISAHQHKRGVIVSVYALSGNQDDLQSYEEGAWGKFYNG